MKAKSEQCESERDKLKAENEELHVKLNELQAKVDEMEVQIKGLVNDTTVTGISLRKLTTQYDKINALNDELLKKLKEKNANEEAETRKLLQELQELQADIQKQQDALKELEKELNEKKANLDAMKLELDNKDKALEAKNKRLIELQAMLNRKDSVVKALRDKVSLALKGYEGEGLTVEERNGKVYVSLEEKLLFKSGKWDVDPAGQKALKKLAEVLEKNPDINIMIEGHTDNVPYKGSSSIEDNWDLSVKRATSIVKIILQNKNIDPKRLTASGRGEFFPIDPANTPEARQKNRRTEIILTPKLDELFQILESE
ncbi:MAG: OmpA family protein [Marinilabiliales bacterium]